MAGVPDSVAQLCPSCGLCCNGVLFADVKLDSSDDAARLEALGLPLQRGSRTIRFHQPCQCFDGNLCRIYADRPVQCRAFECGLLKRVQSGPLTAAEALKKIATARRMAEKIRALLKDAGNADDHVALTKRYAAVMKRPVDLSAGDEAAEIRGRLMLAVSDLMHFLEREFRA